MTLNALQTTPKMIVLGVLWACSVHCLTWRQVPPAVLKSIFRFQILTTNTHRGFLMLWVWPIVVETISVHGMKSNCSILKTRIFAPKEEDIIMPFTLRSRFLKSMEFCSIGQNLKIWKISFQIHCDLGSDHL